MFLKSLYDFAKRNRLLDNLPLQSRTVHAVVPISVDGKLRFDYLLPLTQKDEKGKDRAGRELLLPRFPGENNGGKAYFLAESTIPLFGRDRNTGESISTDPKKGGNSWKAFNHFWDRIDQAYQVTKDIRLAALLAFRSNYLQQEQGKILARLPFLEVRSNKKGNPEFVGRTGPSEDDYLPLKSCTIVFSVDGEILAMDSDPDPLRDYWFAAFNRQAFQNQGDETSDSRPEGIQSTICLITGETGLPIARSHKPKILGVPGLSSGGYVVSFAKEAPAFSSYGFEMGQNAPVSETAAAAYALALNQLLTDEDYHLSLGPTAVCFWAKDHPEVAKKFNFLLSKAYPAQVKEFLRQPFDGIFDRQVWQRERLYTVALTGNAGRVVILQWLNQTLEEAIRNFARWEEHLRIVSLFPEADTTPPPAARKGPPPFAVPSLARVSLRRSKAQKDEKLIADRIVQLYRAALDGTSLPITMLKPILDEFQTALVKDSEKNPTYPFNRSRFALIKLILFRGPKEDDFMPQVELADTPDPAYNCGRLLAVLETLQNRSRLAGRDKGGQKKTDRPGAGVIERYYGRASSAPGLVFPMLLGLSRHHLTKLQKGNDKDKKAASAIEKRKIEILANLRADPNKPDSSPDFPALLSLQLQGRFALGFYQQKAHDLEQLRRYLATKGQEGDNVAESEEDAGEGSSSN